MLWPFLRRLNIVVGGGDQYPAAYGRAVPRPAADDAERLRPARLFTAPPPR
jgi:hypothetical protein